MKRRGFTLIELLVVIVILGILITLGSKGLRAAKINAKKAQARVEMKSIETAILSYYAKYSRLPSVEFNGDRVMSFGESSSADIISVLTMPAESDELNPSSVVFLDAQSSDSPDKFVDPWGYEYVIGLDTDYDGKITTLDGQEVRRKVAIASVGFYELNGSSNTNDLITTWQ